MAVQLKPDTESRLQKLAATTGRALDELVEDAIANYLADLAQVPGTLDSRYDEIKDGSVKPLDGEKFFQEHDYYWVKPAPRGDRVGVDRSDPESKFGPFFSSDTAKCFHRLGCKWLRTIPKRNRTTYASHLEARLAGKKPCKNGCAS